MSYMRIKCLSCVFIVVLAVAFIWFGRCRSGVDIIKGEGSWLFICESKHPGVVSGFAGSSNLSDIKSGSITIETESGVDRVDIDRLGRFWGYVGELNVKSVTVDIDGISEIYHPRFNGSGMYMWVLIRD
jgi:hypothetical protein